MSLLIVDLRNSRGFSVGRVLDKVASTGRKLRDATIAVYRRPDLGRDGWNINNDKADRIARKMLHGQWTDTSNIRVDCQTCAALNGRAIVEAVIRSGVTVPCRVVMES